MNIEKLQAAAATNKLFQNVLELRGQIEEASEGQLPSSEQIKKCKTPKEYEILILNDLNELSVDIEEMKGKLLEGRKNAEEEWVLYGCFYKELKKIEKELAAEIDLYN